MARHETIITGRALGYRGVQVLEYIRLTIAEHGEAPSYDMIAEACDISSRSNVCEIVQRLTKRGLLIRKPWRGRGYRTIDVPNRNFITPRPVAKD